MANDVVLAREDNKPNIVFQDHTPVNLTGTLTPTDIKTVVLPGGSMGKNGSLRITTLWSCTNNANGKTINVVFGGNIVGGASVSSNPAIEMIKHVRNRNSESAQIMMDGSSLNTSSPFAVATLAVNTAANVNISFRATLGNIADTITLESVIIEVLPGR